MSNTDTVVPDRLHLLEDFKDFPWEQITAEWLQQVGGYGFGGVINGVDLNQPVATATISFVRQDLSADVWVIPRQLRHMFESYRRAGEDAVRQQFRDLLHVPRRAE